MATRSLEAQLRQRRIWYSDRVLLTSKDRSAKSSGTVVDLSIGGMFIATTTPFEVGEIIRCEMKFDRLPFVAAAQVVWIRPFDEGKDKPVGIAVAFVGLNPGTKRLIHRQISHYTHSGGRLRVGAPPARGTSSGSSALAQGKPALPAAGSIWRKINSLFRH